MLNISVSSVSQGLARGLEHLRHLGLKSPSRNGDVFVSPWPVLTTYTNPKNHVLFSPVRDANPFFHLMEALWMLAGRRDVSWPRTFVERMKEFSDDGTIFHGAYGFRWRTWFGVDQLSLIIGELRTNPTSRRCVLEMWDATADLGKDGKDLPCNTHAYFDTTGGKLNMTVCCRSNDIWWGCYGANAVHFSILLEYMAACVGLPMGVYRQFSSNYHIYTNVAPIHDEKWFNAAHDDAFRYDYYTQFRTANNEHQRILAPPLAQIPLIDSAYTPETGQRLFDKDLSLFMADATADQRYDSPFFNAVAKPMFCAWVSYKNQFYDEADEIATKIKAEDWRTACVEWLLRRRVNRQAKELTQ